MSELRYSATIKRPIRQDPPVQLGRPTRLFLEQAVREGRVEDAKQWLDYLAQETGGIRFILGAWCWHLVRYYLDRVGEASWPDLVQASLTPWLGTTAGLAGTPIAQAVTGPRRAQLSVEGLASPVYIQGADERFLVTLGAPAEQEERHAASRLKLDAAIEEGDLANFSLLLDARRLEERLIHDILSDWTWALMTILGNRWGEAALGEIQRATEEPWVTVRYAAISNITPEESLQLSAEAHRGHFAGRGRDGSLTILEEPDRYVMLLDPCGSGGRMVQGDPVGGNGSRLDPPYSFMRIAGAYPWTWGIQGVGAYCSHCAIVNQILPIEWLGTPMRGTAFSDSADQPCRWFIYKRRDAVPDEAFSQVGLRRPDPAHE